MRTTPLALLYALGLLACLGPVHGQSPEPAGMTLRVTSDLSLNERANDRAASQPLQPLVAQPCAPTLQSSSVALGLGEVLERILCKSPSMQQALASAAEQQANVILAEQAKRPRLSANSDLSFSASPATTLLSATRARNLNLGLALNWIMFDFGASDAGVRSARLALTAAIADQSSAQLAQYEDALRLYVAALVSQARLQSLETAEKAARTSTDIARARHAAQAGTLAEKLQAESALALVTSDATRARGQARSAQGRLAIALGFRATQAVNLIPIELARATARFTGPIQDREPPSMSELWIALQDQHPRLAAIRAEIASLEARLDQSKAESSGSVTLNSGLALNRGLGGTSGRENSPSSNLSIQYTVPLFEGASRDARLAQISAQVLRRQAQLAQLEQELESELWQALQQLSAERDNLKATDALLATSKQAEEVALGRFKAGVGSLSDLLNAQSVHSQAIFQRANASIEELQAQIRLVFSTGKTKPP